jgi:cytochrome c1
MEVHPMRGWRRGLALWFVGFSAFVVLAAAVRAARLRFAAERPSPSQVLAPAAETKPPPATVVSGEMHAVHLEGDERLACGACHDVAAATFAPPTQERCLGCHDAHPLAHGDELAGNRCIACHVFKTVERAAVATLGCLSCHREVPGASSGGRTHVTADCRRCHDAHVPAALSTVDCGECHGDERAIMAALAGGHERCEGCHAPHRPAATARQSCGECHPRAVGHPSCVGCHEPHPAAAAGVAVRDCRGCHREVRVLARHDDCRACHAPHDPLGAARQACSRCHRDERVRHAGGAAGDCVGCHDPHPRTSGACGA